MRRADRARRGLALLLLVTTLGCGRDDRPRLKATALPGTAAAAGVTDLRFQLRNIGGRTLTLDGVAPVCGCAPKGPLPATLAPGAATMLDLRCRTPRTTGEVRREVALRSSDPSKPVVVLPATLMGSGAGPRPAALYFGYVAIGESATRNVVLPAPVAVERLPRPADAALTLEPMPPRPEAPYGVRVRFTPQRAGVVHATLDLGPAGGPLPVAAVGHDGVLAFPAEVRVPTAGAAALPAVTLVGTRETPLAIARIEYPPGISGELRAVVPGRQFRLVLRGRAAGASGGSDVIRLHGADQSNGAHSGAPLLTIPVVAAGAGLDAPAT